MEDVTEHVFWDAGRSPSPSPVIGEGPAGPVKNVVKPSGVLRGFAKRCGNPRVVRIPTALHCSSGPVPVLVVPPVGLKFPSMNRFPGNISRQDRL